LANWCDAVAPIGLVGDCGAAKIDDTLERSFYEQQTLREHWSVRELVRQKESALFLRLAASKDKAGILQLAAQGQLIEQPADLLREPYVFEFLKIPEPYLVAETQLETLLCNHLQQFLLELGKGFTFVGRQYRVTLNNTHYKVDLFLPPHPALLRTDRPESHRCAAP
jgi:predicted nuclease of restriction endonuclease-like (RecB) superfamily